MEETEVLVVGQGLAGTWLSWWLYQAGIPFKVIDQQQPDSASRRAAGLINPVTGRRMVTTWMIDELIPFTLQAYSSIGRFLNESFISETAVIDFFPSVQMLQSFQKRHEEDNTYLIPGDEREKYAEWFRYEFGWGAIRPCLLVAVEKLLSRWRQWLKQNGYLNEEAFNPTLFSKPGKSITYSDMHASHIVFCDGASGANNPYFEKLPFALNKGEGMLVEINRLPENLVFKKGMILVPYKENILWLGSSYEWSFKDDRPSESFRMQAEIWLKNFVKTKYNILEHFAAVRPATLERRPFVGFHPTYPSIGILNGMGTKGCSLAPYFGKQLVEKINGIGNIDPAADISRFEKILTR
jgi:glycine/D-amino acid oxidase-like deaminating enzyme